EGALLSMAGCMAGAAASLPFSQLSPGGTALIAAVFMASYLAGVWAAIYILGRFSVLAVLAAD
ncbi:MAG: hypothetical protein LBH39_00170, partial [Clostridiales Family XIII bacterium]|nr:hypothetical protein [Clostridiales Family XIII bacterium]